MADEQKIIIKRTDKSTLLIGVPFFLMGLAAIVLGSFEAASDPEGMMVVYGIGSLFSVIGLLLILGRSAIEIDLQQGKVLSWKGLLRPMFRKEYDLEDFTEVTLTREERRSSSSNGSSHTYIVYPVRLSGPVTSIALHTSREYHEGRQHGEKWSKKLVKPFADSAMGRRVVRDHDKLDESFRDRLIREERESQTAEKQDDELPFPLSAPSATAAPIVDMQENAWADNPKLAEMASIGVQPRITRDGDTLIFEIPPLGIRKQHVGAMAVTAVFVFVFFGLFACVNPGALCGAVFFAPLAMLAVGAKFKEQMFGHQRITVNPRELSVHARGKTVTIPVEQLEELQIASGPAGPQGHISVAGGGVITALSDQVSVKFGDSLSTEGLKHLHGEICEAIKGTNDSFSGSSW